MISEAIRSAVDATFEAHARQEIMAALSTIPEADAEVLRIRPTAEFLAAAVWILAYGNREIFFQQLMNAVIEPRDVIYVLQSPGIVEPSLTCEELVRRYRELSLPVPELITSNI